MSHRTSHTHFVAAFILALLCMNAWGVPVGANDPNNPLLVVTAPEGGVIWGDKQFSNGKAIECGGGATKCVVRVPLGTIFVLNQQALGVYDTGRWTDDCATATGNACMVKMDGPKNVSAALHNNGVTVSSESYSNAILGVDYYDASKAAQGVPYGASILSCGTDAIYKDLTRTECSATVRKGTKIIAWLNRADLSEWMWTTPGFCSGERDDPCARIVNGDVRFSAKPYLIIDIVPPQNGTITFLGKTCPGECNVRVDVTTTNVAFQAKSAAGYLLTNWGGDCAGTTSDTCTMTLKSRNGLSATFLK